MVLRLSHGAPLLDNASASITNALRPAGLQNSSGVISTSFLKDTADPEWTNDPAMKAFLSFMDKYYPDGDKDDGNAALRYAAAETLFHVLSQCGDDLSRENIMKQSASLQAYITRLSCRASPSAPGRRIFTPSRRCVWCSSTEPRGGRSVTCSKMLSSAARARQTHDK